MHPTHSHDQVTNDSLFKVLRSFQPPPGTTTANNPDQFEGTDVTGQQADYLARLGGTGSILDWLRHIPKLTIRHSQTLTLPSIAYWNGRRWIIEVNADLSQTERARRALHELKHIIDYPQQHKLYPDGGSAIRHQSAWAETIADHFAAQVLGNWTTEAKPTNKTTALRSAPVATAKTRT